MFIETPLTRILVILSLRVISVGLTAYVVKRVRVLSEVDAIR